jgi:MFS family permease
VSLYTIGLAVGPLFLVPLSETYGRRWIYVTASSSLVAFSAGAGAAHNFATYLICRFFSGWLGSASIALGAGTISDLWPPGEQRAVASLLFVTCPFLAPSLGPLVGAYTTNAHGGNWRWTQWILVFVGLPIWAMVLLMQETMAPQESHRYSRKMSANSVLRPFRMFFSDWIIMSLSVHTSFGYAIIFSFFSSFFYVLKNKYGFETREASLCFLGLILGYSLAIMMFIVMEKTIVGSKRLTSDGRTTPERRLYSGIFGAVLLLVGELWYVGYY